MPHATSHQPLQAASAALCLALACAPALAAPSDVVWVDNETFALHGCSGSDALPGSQDPQALMRALRERGLADANQTVRLRGDADSTVTLTPVSATWRCDGAPSSVVFRLSTFDRTSGQASTIHLVSRMPAAATMRPRACG